jgi:hypothetical protein
MVMKKSIITILFAFTAVLSYCQQYWEEIDIPDEFIVREIKTIYTDTVENNLWIGGHIQHADSIPGSPHHFLLKYDGVNWQHFGPFSGENIWSICRFQDKIVFGGSFQNYQDYYNIPDEHRGIAYIQNDTVGHFDGMGVAGGLYQLKVIDNQLFAIGIFDTICGIAANSVATYDGFQWNTFNDFPLIVESGNGRFFCGAKYNELYYIGGNFSGYDYFGENGGNIINNNEIDWELTGGGVYGGLSGVSQLEEYQNELYASGVIFKNAGNAGNQIQKWNGTNWSSVGGDLKGYGNSLGAYAPVNVMKLYNNELYIGGFFRYAGDIVAEGVVKWDGEKYCSLGGDTNYYINALDFYRDTLYMGGGIAGINEQPPVVPILLKYVGNFQDLNCSTVGIKENDALLQLDIYPSPATNEINIYLPNGEYKNTNIEIYNILGQQVIAEIAMLKEKTIIDIKALNNGQYFVLAKQNGVVIAGGKFVKE